MALQNSNVVFMWFRQAIASYCRLLLGLTIENAADSGSGSVSHVRKWSCCSKCRSNSFFSEISLCFAYDLGIYTSLLGCELPEMSLADFGALCQNNFKQQAFSAM